MKELDWEWVEVTTSSDVNLGHSWQGPLFFAKNMFLFFKKTRLFAVLGQKPRQLII